MAQLICALSCQLLENCASGNCIDVEDVEHGEMIKACKCSGCNDESSVRKLKYNAIPHHELPLFIYKTTLFILI